MPGARRITVDSLLNNARQSIGPQPPVPGGSPFTPFQASAPGHHPPTVTRPTAQHSSPPTRRILRPKSRRATSLSRGTPLSTPAPRLAQPQGLDTTLPPLAHSLSPPIISHALPTPNYVHSTKRPLPYQDPAPFAALPRDTPTSGPGSDTRWSTGNDGSLGGLRRARGLPVGESQHLLTITPQDGERLSYLSTRIRVRKLRTGKDR